MSEAPKNPLTLSGVLQQIDAVMSPPARPDRPTYWNAQRAQFPKRLVLLDPDTGVVLVGTVNSAAMQSLRDWPIDRHAGFVDPFARPQGQQRLDLVLHSMHWQEDPEGYLRRALSMACDMAAQL